MAREGDPQLGCLIIVTFYVVVLWAAVFLLRYCERANAGAA